MSDYVLVDGDSALFFPAFGKAIVLVQPGTLRGSGPATVNGTNMCIEGDEQSVKVSGCTYVAPPYVIPGIGTLKIESLSSIHIAKKTRSGTTPVILKGGQFDASFEIQSAAQQPGSPPIPDPTVKYLGKGKFVTSNAKLRGT